MAQCVHHFSPQQVTSFNKTWYKYYAIPEHPNIIISNISFTSKSNTAGARSCEVRATLETLTFGP